MITGVKSLYDVGLKREINQDSILMEYDANIGLFAVADGMGGHSFGEVASGYIVTQLREWWLPVMANASNYTIQDVTSLCLDKIVEINRAIFTEFSSRNAVGGSTLVLMIVWGESYAILHAGDSRAYRHLGGVTQILTVDDVWENLEAIKATMTEEEIMESPYRGKLTMAIGTMEDISVHFMIRPIEEGEQILLCSDGIYKYCDGNELHAILADENFFHKTEEKKLRQMEKNVIANGARDNYSAILCRLK